MSTAEQLTDENKTSIVDMLSGSHPVTLSMPTGAGLNAVGAEIVSRWKSETGGRSACVVVAPNETTAIQWKRYDIVAISRMRALQQARRTGCVLGHSTKDVGLVVIEQADIDRGSELSEIRKAFANATFLLLNGTGSTRICTAGAPKAATPFPNSGTAA